MTDSNYKFMLADDHKGNKVLVVIKGEFSSSLVSQTTIQATEKAQGQVNTAVKSLMEAGDQQ